MVVRQMLTGIHTRLRVSVGRHQVESMIQLSRGLMEFIKTKLHHLHMLLMKPSGEVQISTSIRSQVLRCLNSGFEIGLIR